MTQKKNPGTEKEIPKKRLRRSKHEIERSLFEAATRIIKKYGFPGLTVTGIIQQAKVDPPVFYNRYTGMEDFIEKYVRNYDYWLRDSLHVSLKGDNPVKEMEIILNELIDSLVDNVPMQKLIAWEMNENNYITRRTTQERDLTSGPVIDYFRDALEGCSARFDYSLALLIGGLYYLIIHRDLGTFNYIDFSKKEAMVELKKNLSVILNKVFDDYNTSAENTPDKDNLQMMQAARELIKHNVGRDIIKKATGLSDAALKSLYKEK